MNVRILCRSAVVCLSLLLCACAGTRPIEVVEKKEFIQMARALNKEMTARGLLDENGAYAEAAGGAVVAAPYGEILYRQLSPSFMFDDAVGHVYLGDTFHATRTPRSRALQSSHGFTLLHPTQTVRVLLLAVADWNGDGEKEWIVSCRVVPLRGGRTREYYLLVPPPRNARERLQGTVVAVNDCFGLACTLSVKNAAVIRREGDDAATPVHDVAPGLENVTEAPAATPRRDRDGLEERSL